MSKADITSLVRPLHWKKLVRPGRHRRSLFGTDRLCAFLHDALNGWDFAALHWQFTALACESTSGRRVVMREGSVSTA